jgi:hypothetical protein
MSDADQYRKQAEDARQIAAKTANQDCKTFWLRMAEDWDRLARVADDRRKGW